MMSSIGANERKEDFSSMFSVPLNFFMTTKNFLSPSFNAGISSSKCKITALGCECINIVVATVRCGWQVTHHDLLMKRSYVPDAALGVCSPYKSSAAAVARTLHNSPLFSVLQTKSAQNLKGGLILSKTWPRSFKMAGRSW